VSRFCKAHYIFRKCNHIRSKIIYMILLLIPKIKMCRNPIKKRVWPQIFVRIWEGPMNPAELNLGIYLFVYVYKATNVYIYARRWNEILYYLPFLFNFLLLKAIIIIASKITISWKQSHLHFRLKTRVPGSHV